jgi:DNA-binding NarL/FixJ family response regulator
MSETKLRLLIAEDHQVVRRAFAAMLALEPDIEVVAEAADGVEAVEKARAWRPDVVLMDIQMPRMNGIVATRTIRQERPQTAVVVLTTYETDDVVFDAITAGAQAYLLKDAEEKEILETIRGVTRGETNLSARIAGKVIAEFRRLRTSAPQTIEQSDGIPLTEREESILALVAQGDGNKEIARKLDLAEGTVKNYVSKILDKLHARSRTELAIRAQGLLKR